MAVPDARQLAVVDRYICSLRYGQTTLDQLLDPVAISRAESLGLHARFIVEGYMAGEHKSPYRGFAIEFAQHREYAPGDDTRHLDWKVLGRTDRYYIKQYEQETNYVANLLLDGSESMKYGSGKITKLHYGKMMAACLAYLILHQRDAVALGLFDTTVRDYAPRSRQHAPPSTISWPGSPRSSRRSRRTSPPCCTTWPGRSAARASSSSSAISSTTRRRCSKASSTCALAATKSIVFHVMDPCELEFPFTGLVEFDGLEEHPENPDPPRRDPEELPARGRGASASACAKAASGTSAITCW